MTAISNFTQAMKELSGFDKDGNKLAEPEKKAKEQATIEPNYEHIEHTPRKDVFNIERKKTEMNMPEFNGTTGSTITGAMIIKGQISGGDPIRVDGKVYGNIQATEMMINGTVIGDVKGETLTINGSIKGNIHTHGDAKIGSSATVVGDVKTRSVYVQGKIKGNLDICEITDLTETAYVSGDIVTGSLATSSGGIINGKITTNSARPTTFNEKELFDIGEQNGE